MNVAINARQLMTNGTSRVQRQ